MTQADRLSGQDIKGGTAPGTFRTANAVRFSTDLDFAAPDEQVALGAVRALDGVETDDVDVAIDNLGDHGEAGRLVAGSSASKRPGFSNAGGGGAKPRAGDDLSIGGSEEDPRDRLARLFAAQAESATAEQRAAVRRWQAKDRFYEKVQESVGGRGGDRAAQQAAYHLDRLAQPLPADTEVWRGIRSTAEAFGLDAEELHALIGRDWVEQRFMSTTTSRQVATTEFNQPGQAPALLHVTARAGAYAIWVPPLGDDESAGQSELLFAPGGGVRIVGVDRSAQVSVIAMEVSGGQVR